ncbi:MAG TPA: C25 family cysteine peptidase, partial [Candidatus Methanoperedens sp.]|nr:C25 family cysteine peptidase [Candidatus Methanoperedens sp.]
AQVRLNGVDIGEVRWNGLATQQATLTFDAALLADGENAVEVAALADTAAPYGIFYLDSFVLRYRSRYQARGDRLAFSAGGNPVVRVSGFGTPNVLLFDVTRAKRPVRILATPFADGAGSWGVAIAPQSPDARYEALTREAAAAPAWVAADAPSALRDPRNRGRYVVVTTRDLLGPARRLAELRGGIVADIEDVYDEFNHGSPSPFALRRFLTYATRRWRVRPRYVVLAGDGTFDYRDNLGVGGNLIPPMMIGTGQGLFPSDTWFADSAGGPAPELAIGRLPVASAAELDRLIDKIILRESTPDRAWTASLLALADDADRAGDFPADSDRIAALAPPALTVNRIHLGALTLAAARAGLFAAVRDGAGLVNYVGHAGYDVLATEGLLTSADVDLLENAARPTVLTAMTCLAGDFAFPGSPGLAELLVRRETGGAAAVWAPTGLSVNDPAVRLAEGFYAAAFAGTDAVRIGDVVLAAQRAYEQARNPAALLRIYVLLGDPAMRLR